MVQSLERVLDHLDAHRQHAIERWCELLRIPSIGTDPVHAGDTRAAADWLRAQFRDLGFAAEVRATVGQPMVVAHHPGSGGAAPHVLYYGHYDVQPPDPLELWETPPFVPTLVDGPRGPRMTARGAVDDKGQVMTWLEALRGWVEAHGAPPVPVTAFLEGEEESGSPSLEPFLTANREELARADLCVVSDTLMWDVDTPAIGTSIRGLVYLDITLEGPSRDLHSGLYGGAVANPLNVLARILGEVHDADGRIRIPGFYDDVIELDDRQRAAWAALPFDEAAFLGAVGLHRSQGEAGRSTLERLWARPTADVNGLWGGYMGEGTKTVIPARAHAKLSFRLVPEQDPTRVLDGVKAFIDQRLPPDCRVEITTHGMAPALRIPTGSTHVAAATRALEAAFGRPPALIGMGGSIPAVEAIKRILGLDSLLIGFGLDDDRVHAPNEKFELVCFERGIRAHARLLAELAG